MVHCLIKGEIVIGTVLIAVNPIQRIMRKTATAIATAGNDLTVGVVFAIVVVIVTVMNDRIVESGITHINDPHIGDIVVKVTTTGTGTAVATVIVATMTDTIGQVERIMRTGTTETKVLTMIIGPTASDTFLMTISPTRETNRFVQLTLM